ncbi:MAG: flagellar protein FliS [Oscillospiraceae bacterium]|nr:flagellar protein FliS [Oscillospiraceae bacterium]
MDNKGFQEYRHQADEAINTMSQGELLLLLYNELVKRLTRAGLALDRTDYSLFEASVDRSLEIIRYLDDTLDRQYPISGNLARLYEFFSYELQRVKAGRNRTELERVRAMASELRDTFREAQKNAEAEAAEATAAGK